MGFNLDDYIMHHVLNSQEWNLPFLSPIHLPQYLSLHAVMLILCALFLIVIFCLLYRKDGSAPHGLTNVLEVFILYIRDEIAVAFLGEKDGRRLTPLFCTFFFFILGMNLMGLIPIFLSATANINVTGGLAAISLGFMTLGCINKNGIKGFIKALVPHGVPGPILLIVVPIEFLSLFIRSFALMIRLFANMLAGHIAIMALLGLIVVMGLIALPVIVLAIFISLLEVFVAFLQAYIFTLLSAIFIGQMYHPEH